VRAAALALLLSGCGASASYGAVVSACEAAEAVVEASCAPGEDTVCTGDITNEHANAQIDCIRATCDLVQQAIERGDE